MWEFLFKKSIKQLVYLLVGIVLTFWILGIVSSFYSTYKIIKISNQIRTYQRQMLEAGQKTLQHFSNIKNAFLMAILNKNPEYFNQIDRSLQATLSEMEKTKTLATRAHDTLVLTNLNKLEKFLNTLDSYIREKKEAILNSEVNLSQDIVNILNKFNDGEKRVKLLANTMLNNRYKDLDAALRKQHSTILFSVIINLILFVVSIILAGIITYLITQGFEKEIIKLEEVTERIKEKDLTVSIKVPEDSQNEVHIISQRINQIISNLKALLSQVKDGISQISSGAEEFSVVVAQNVEHSKQAFENVRDLLNYVENFKHKIENLNVSLNQLTEAVNEISKNANETSQTSDDAYVKMNRLNEVLSHLISEIQEISSSADLIQDIAEKTNLLALNATIEAARAGEAGKGFAVVAAEIKELSKSSGESASQIGKKVQHLVETSEETELTVKATQEAISRTNEYTASVASAVEEQTAVISEIAETLNKISQEVNTLDRIAGEIQARTEEAEHANKEMTKAAESLAKTATMLQSTVAMYRV